MSMLRWLLSTQAQKDLAAFSLSGSSGYGMMSGERIGHISIVSRLIFLGSDLTQAIRTYDRSLISGFDVPLGLFALNREAPPGFSFHGHFLIIKPSEMKMAYWRFVNGSSQPSREVMEKLNDS